MAQVVAGAEVETRQGAGDGTAGERRSWAERLRPLVPWVTAGAVTVVALAVLLVVAHKPGDDNREVELRLGGAQSFQSLPEFTADLKPSPSRRHFLRVEIVLQLDETDVPRLRAKQEPVLAAIQGHLRDHEPQQLVGKAGAERLRQDLLALINREIAPAQVRAVLFTKFLMD